MTKSNLNSGIYILSWVDNFNFYLGQTQDFNKRLNEHLNLLKNNKHYNFRVQKTFSKLGPPILHIVEECEVEELDCREQFYLNLLYGHKNCLNLAKFVESPNRGIFLSKETKLKMSKSKKGKNHPLFGKKHSQQTKTKMADSHRGRLVSTETRNKISKTKKNKTLSKVAKHKISRAVSKPIVQLSKNNIFIKKWKSATEAAKTLNIHQENISMCCSKKRKSAGGFVWKFFKRK